VSGSRQAFVRAMNRRAQQLGLTNTHYANPIGLDEPGNYSTARDLVDARRGPAHQPLLPHDDDRPSVTLTTGDRTAHVRQPQHARAPHGWVNGVKSGHTSRRATCSSARAPNGIQLVSRRARHAERRRARRRHVALLRSFGALPAITAASARRGVSARADPLPPRRRARARRRPHVRADRARAVSADDVTRRTSVPRRVDGPIVAGQSFGASRSCQDGRVVAACRSSRPPASRPRTSSRRPKSWFTQPAAVLLVVAVDGGTVLVGGSSRGPAQTGRARDGPRRMIITVTLNTRHRQDAVGAELPARPPPPHRRADDDAGRQGRQRRARAQGARRSP
jgi:D-alanyl-D-alanine carboxypeptidase (penicillin-binding protein 5/6)